MRETEDPGPGDIKVEQKAEKTLQGAAGATTNAPAATVLAALQWLFFMFANYFLILLLLLASCSSSQTPTIKKAKGSTGITLPIHRGFASVTASTTIAMPPTSIACPLAGKARVLVTAPLALGSHQNIVYTLNTGTYDAPTQGELVRYDVQTGRSSELLTVMHAHIYEAQISTDGQWLLFVTTTGSAGRQAKLQALRLDGQGLQTLYCAEGYGIQQIQWSANQRFLAFYNVVDEQGVVYLLDMARGTLQTELTAPTGLGFILRAWLDATHIYLTDTAQDTLYSYIYLLDTTKGAHQHLNDLLIVFFRQYGDFDSSYDGSHVLISHGGCPQGSCSGPSSIALQAITGGPQQTIYNSRDYDVIAVRAIDSKSLLFIIGNTFSLNGTDLDKSHNGLWKINIDGTGLTRLIPITPQQYTFLNYVTQEPWSNISRDGNMYVLQVNGFRSTPNAIVETDTLLVGSLRGNGSKARVFASTQDGSQLVMTGWTEM